MSAARAGGNSSQRWIRPPVVAGQFYPGSPVEIQAQLRQFAAADAATTGAGVPPQSLTARGAVCPHAGWRYSGALAYRTLAQCKLPATVLILAVNHRHRNPPPWSIWPEGAWQTPLGDVPVNAELAAALMQAIPALEASPAPHAQDHATEVLLPLLQSLADAARPRGSGAAGELQIVPIVPFLPAAVEGAAVEVGERIGAVLQSWPEPVFVLASNDMTHFAPAARARTQDAKAIARMEALDAAGLLSTARSERITMCGAQPVAAMLAAARVLGAKRGRLVDYTHSGAVTGDDSDVVAYAGVILE